MITEQDLDQLRAIEAIATKTAIALYKTHFDLHKDFDYYVEGLPSPESMVFHSLNSEGITLVCEYRIETIFESSWEDIKNPEAYAATLRVQLERMKIEALEKQAASYEISKKIAIKKIAELKEKFNL